jgi:hypothetical protein
MDWYTTLVLMHIIGTVLGVGGATFVEVYLINALRDGVVSPDETVVMQTTYNILRVGFFLLVLSGFGFLILARITEQNEWFYSLQFWAKLSIVGVIAINAALLQLHRIPLLLGSAIAFVSWYAALILGVMRTADLPLIGILVVYVVSIVIAYILLRALHRKYAPHSLTS